MIDFSEDIDLMVSLLNEYSEKLLNVCSQINRFRKQLRGYVIASLSLIVFVSIFGYDFFIDSNLLFLKEKWQQIVFFIYIAMSFLLYSVNFIDEDLRKLQVLKRDANILSIKLEKVIHVVSQFQEHNSIRSLAVSLELDFRLADAESALQYYNVMEKKKSPFRLF